MSSTLAQTPTRRVATQENGLALRFILLWATLALLWFILCRDLSLEWSSNEQYSYGWFVPFFAAFLFWLRWEDRHLVCLGRRPSRPAEMHDQAGRLIAESGQRPNFRIPTSVLCLLASVLLLLLLLPLRLFEIANPDWRPLSWMHALSVVGLTLLVIGYWGGRAAVRHFVFPVCFILVAVPWLTPIEAPLVQWLMRIVAAVATETLTLFGTPAQLEGSLIRVNNGVVGVSEACSGVRSLQTSLMIGLLFGELKRLSIARRFWLIGAALAIALVANFGRALFLVWIAATQNLAAVERWHDIAGYAIVGAVFVGTIAIASALAKGRTEDGHLVRLGRRTSRPAEEHDQTGRLIAESGQRPNFRLPPFSFILLTFSWLLLVEASVSGWYRWHERNLVPARRWTVQWPETEPGFRELPIEGHTSEMLRYDRGRQVSWAYTPIGTPDAPNVGPLFPAERTGRAFLFFFRWEPGTATVLRARAHRPEGCLPAVGWRPVGESGIRFYPVAEVFALPFQHFSFMHEDPGSRPIYAETFFCLREDLVRAGESADTIPFSHWSIPERWEAVRKGLRNPGQQVMEFVLMTRQPLSKDQAEAEFAELEPNLVKMNESGSQEPRK